MDRLSLRQLSCFIAVADTGRFGLAAERVGLSQPALSEQIAQLERALGVAVFERGRHGARLTPAGREALVRARLIAVSVEEMRDAAAGAAGSLGGLIRIGALPTVAPYVLPQLIPALHKDHPDLRLHVREAASVELDARLAAGDFDVILATPPETTAGLTVEPLFEETLRLGVPSDHPHAAKRAVRLEALADMPFLTLERGHHLADQVRALADEAGATVLDDYAGTSLAGLRQMVGLGMGAAVFPDLYVRAELRADPAVRVLDVAPRAPSRWIALTWRAASPRAQDFRDLGARIRDRAAAALQA